MKVIWLLLSLTLLFWASPATAQDLSEAEIKAYQDAATAAAEAYSEDRFRDAVTHLQDARRIYDHPDLTYNLGRSYQQMGWCDRARRQYADYQSRSEISSEDQAKVKEQIELLTSCKESRQLALTCSPSNVNISVSPQPSEAPECGSTVTIMPGRYTLTASRSGFIDSVQTLSVTPESDDFAVDITLDARPMNDIEPPEPTDSGDWRPIAGWSMLGAGGLMLGTGFILDATSPSAEEVATSGSDPDSRKSLILGLYVGGAAVAAVGGGILVWHLLDSEDDSVAISPTTNGIIVHGRF